LIKGRGSKTFKQIPSTSTHPPVAGTFRSRRFHWTQPRSGALERDGAESQSQQTAQYHLALGGAITQGRPALRVNSGLSDPSSDRRDHSTFERPGGQACFWRANGLSPTPDVADLGPADPFCVATLDALLRMKLTTFRDGTGPTGAT